MQRGSAVLLLGVVLILLGIVALMLTDRSLYWAVVALGAITGTTGGISIAQRARA